jgi:imidazolonepropionase-like amidohydrolase
VRRRQVLFGLGAHAAALALPALALPSLARAQGVARAWVGATIWTGDGQVIEDGMLISAGDRISVVSKAGPVPSGAELIEARGAIITPGWVATETALGLVEVELEATTVDARPRQGEDSIRAAFSAADGYNQLSTLVGVARREGVTSAVSSPEGGLVSGTSAWVDLVEKFPEPAVVREDVALHASLLDLAENSRPALLSELRDALESARLYARSPQSYDQGQTRELSVSVLDLRRLSQVLGGVLPLVVRVARGVDILRLFKLAESYRLRLILSGAEEGWSVANQIAAARVPVIVDPLRNLPVSFASLQAKRENAAILGAAGVPLIISSFDAYSAHNLRQLAGNAVASGLSRAAATRALAFEAARAFGQGADYGLLAAGRVANFCVWNGDPFELGTWPIEVVVRGRTASTRSRQTELFERYRDLRQVPRGRAGLPPSVR